MRGEDGLEVRLLGGHGGSPPHARGRPKADGGLSADIRITPACAGKTLEPDNAGDQVSDHPRMRGEDTSVG